MNYRKGCGAQQARNKGWGIPNEGWPKGSKLALLHQDTIVSGRWLFKLYLMYYVATSFSGYPGTKAKMRRIIMRNCPEIIDCTYLLTKIHKLCEH